MRREQAARGGHRANDIPILIPSCDASERPVAADAVIAIDVEWQMITKL